MDCKSVVHGEQSHGFNSRPNGFVRLFIISGSYLLSIAMKDAEMMKRP